MLHLYLIKNKAARFFAGLAEYLILSCILCLPCLAYINKFMPLPQRLYVSILIILVIESALMSVQHTTQSIENKLAEHEKSRGNFIKYILGYIINGLIFGLLLMLLILINKSFGTWAWGAAAIMVVTFTVIGTVLHFADKAAYARLKEAEE